jgi:DNA replication initiation complex subunit (GINS family)
MEEEVSYEKLFETLMREKNREELTPIHPEFYDNARQYVEEQSKGFAAESFAHVQSLKSMLKEIFSRREKKILTLAAIKARTNAEVFDVSVMSPEEKELFNNVVLILLSTRSKVFYDEENGSKKLQKEPSKETKNSIRLVAIRDIDAFVGEELETYGPYKKDDPISVPMSMARILLKRGDAKEESLS